eukprot:7671942-Pyramimonas_sp.AAC.1
MGRLSLGRRISAGSRSLTALCILENDPIYHTSIAPIARYSREIWDAQVQQTPFALGFRELRAARGDVWASPPSSWRRVRGPMGA